MEDGIQGNEFSKNAATCDKEGNLWFGGTHGITYFKPSDIQRTNTNWTIRITDFYLHNTPVRKGMMGQAKEDIIDCPVLEAKEFHLNHNHNHFSIEFSPTQYNAPEGITYSYTLQEGKDARWNTLPEGLNRIYFNDMKPGTYHLRVRAQDNYQWSNTVEATIYIRPAWYASGWARMLYTLIAIGIIITLIHLDKKAQKRKEEMLKHMHAEQLNEAKLQFFINISHEIRTPMSLIISPLQRLIEKDKDEDRSKIYKTIHRNSERILHLINQLMDIRKIDKGQMKLSCKETDIIAFIQNIYDSFNELAIIKNIDFQFTHPQDESPQLWIDPDNFDKVFVNLLSNAFKFTPNDGKIGIKVQKQTDSTLTIAISDSGIGINDEDKEYIFNRFYQASNNPQDTPGTGVGLHLTQALVELHHGSIEVLDNEEGSGCQFVITMPMGKEHLQPEDVADSAIEKSVSVQEKIPHILLENVAETTTDERICTSQHNLLLVEDNAEKIGNISRIVAPFLREGIVFEKANDADEYSFSITFPCEIETPSYLVKMQEVSKMEGEGLFFDAKMLPRTAVLRTKRTGDSILTFGGHNKSLKKFFNDKGIDARVYNRIPVIADGSEIYAVCGVDISKKLAVNNKTDKIIKLTCERKGD